VEPQVRELAVVELRRRLTVDDDLAVRRHVDAADEVQERRLPLPDGPAIVVNSPLSIVRSTPLSAGP
jgi:hypothetical protein